MEDGHNPAVVVPHPMKQFFRQSIGFRYFHEGSLDDQFLSPTGLTKKMLSSEPEKLQPVLRQLLKEDRFELPEIVLSLISVLPNEQIANVCVNELKLVLVIPAFNQILAIFYNWGCPRRYLGFNVQLKMFSALLHTGEQLPGASSLPKIHNFLMTLTCLAETAHQWSTFTTDQLVTLLKLFLMAALDRQFSEPRLKLALNLCVAGSLRAISAFSWNQRFKCNHISRLIHIMDRDPRSYVLWCCEILRGTERGDQLAASLAYAALQSVLQDPYLMYRQDATLTMVASLVNAYQDQALSYQSAQVVFRLTSTCCETMPDEPPGLATKLQHWATNVLQSVQQYPAAEQEEVASTGHPGYAVLTEN